MAIEEIELNDGDIDSSVECDGVNLCYPEGVFEMIESCKKCGKWR